MQESRNLSFQEDGLHKNMESYSGNGIGTLNILVKEWAWILRAEQMSKRYCIHFPYEMAGVSSGALKAWSQWPWTSIAFQVKQIRKGMEQRTFCPGKALWRHCPLLFVFAQMDFCGWRQFAVPLFSWIRRTASVPSKTQLATLDMAQFEMGTVSSPIETFINARFLGSHWQQLWPWKVTSPSDFAEAMRLYAVTTASLDESMQLLKGMRKWRFPIVSDFTGIDWWRGNLQRGHENLKGPTPSMPPPPPPENKAENYTPVN